MKKTENPTKINIISTGKWKILKKREKKEQTKNKTISNIKIHLILSLLKTKIKKYNMRRRQWQQTNYFKVGLITKQIKSMLKLVEKIWIIYNYKFEHSKGTMKDRMN